MPLHGLTIRTVSSPNSRPARATRTAPVTPPTRSPDGATALSPTEWMVSDATTAIGTSSAILGFIQLTAGNYEVTRIGGSQIEFSNFPSLAEAVAALSAKPLRRLNIAAAPPRR
ncbi:hypothetical protein D6T64_15020 [Cryobacterium melibiosiphilum]|uniref:Uncharacterized protein n=1 Tax=Cryobacterium melibiosiphilum TaxID=995039 RepID=A0A3A5MMU0_9MICO|nr:hypothetical protein [Cryobacterium melibiosiphilum]RJT87346.1 hypothetical protein D6T64_15020 [Cryobacterium melibiosiphilum]